MRWSKVRVEDLNRGRRRSVQKLPDRCAADFRPLRQRTKADRIRSFGEVAPRRRPGEVVPRDRLRELVLRQPISVDAYIHRTRLMGLIKLYILAIEPQLLHAAQSFGAEGVTPHAAGNDSFITQQCRNVGKVRGCSA